MSALDAIKECRVCLKNDQNLEAKIEWIKCEQSVWRKSIADCFANKEIDLHVF